MWAQTDLHTTFKIIKRNDLLSTCLQQVRDGGHQTWATEFTSFVRDYKELRTLSAVVYLLYDLG